MPEHIQGNLIMNETHVETLKDIHKILKSIGGSMHFDKSRISGGMLDVLKIDHPPKYIAVNTNVDDDRAHKAAEIITSALTLIHGEGGDRKEYIKLAMVGLIEAELEEFA